MMNIKGVTYNKFQDRWLARYQSEGKKVILYSGKSREMAIEARLAYNKRRGTKKCLDCDELVTNTIKVKRCRKCAAIKKKSDIRRHNHRYRNQVLEKELFQVHNLWAGNPDKSIDDSFYEI